MVKVSGEMLSTETIKNITILKGNHDSKERMDTNNKVFVKRWFCKPLFTCCCEARRPFLNFLQTPMLLPQMMDAIVTAYGIQVYIACLRDIKLTNAMYTAEKTRAIIHAIAMTTRYAFIVSVRCLSGQ